MTTNRILMVIIAIGWITKYLSSPEIALGIVQLLLSVWLLILAIRDLRQVRKELAQDDEGGNYGE